MKTVPGIAGAVLTPLLVAATCAGAGFLLQAGVMSGEELASVLNFGGATALFTGARALARCPVCRQGRLWQALL